MSESEPGQMFSGYKPKPDWAVLKVVQERIGDEPAQYEIVGTGSPRRLFSWLTDAEKALHIDHYQYSPAGTDKYRAENPGSRDWVYVRFPS